MKKWFCFVLLCACYATGTAQLPAKENRTMPSGKSNTISTGILAPVGNFSQTHTLGLNIDYAWSQHRFGLLSPQPINQIGFTFNTGIDYYFGKKENTGYTPYKYAQYVYLHLYSGLIYNATEKLNFTLTAGPAIGIYSDDTQFNIGINFNACYYVTKRIAITAAIMLMKESTTDPLAAIALRGSFSF